MIRFVSFLLFLAIAGSAPAQAVADPLEALRQIADKASADWQVLARGLESKIATLLPCDPKSRAAVEEVSRASDARLSALSAYLKASAAKAKADTEAAKRVLAAQAALSGGWVTGHTEAEEQRAAIETQVSDLKESMRKRGSLAGAEQVLIELANIAKERGAKAEEQTARRESLDSSLGDLVVAYQTRQTALDNESTLLDAEADRWKAYYAARVARAITECAIINPIQPQRKKQP
jgi:sugar phosphate isomerase/epimerase